MPVNKEQLEEIEALRSEKTETARVTAPELEAVLYQPIEVLDHGFVRVIDYMGDDSSVVQSARVSYGKDFAVSTDITPPLDCTIKISDFFLSSETLVSSRSR